MSEDDIKAIRKISGRFQGSVKEEIDAYHAAGDNWALKSVAVLDLLSIAINALEATTSRAEVRRDALREALGWACAEMCQWCGIGIEVKQLEEEIMLHNRLYGPKGSWVHLDGETGKFLECRASPIHQLLAADQGQQPDGEERKEG